MKLSVVRRLSLKSTRGQSLIEVVVGLGIGALLIGAGAFAISAMLRLNVTTEKYRAASGFSQELIDTTRSFAGASWQNLYGLAKGSSTTYYLNASGTTFFVVNGQEGMLDNDVTDGLVGEWKFDEDATSTSTLTYDATGNNNHGTLVNSPARATSTCKISNCMSFNAAAGTYVNVPIASGLQISGAVTLAFWMNANAVSSDSGLVGTGIGSGYQCTYHTGNLVYCYVQDGGNNVTAPVGGSA